MFYEMREIGRDKLKEILKEFMYKKDDELYCKYCNKEIDVDVEKHSYNHGYHTRYITKYNCDCNDFTEITIGETD